MKAPPNDRTWTTPTLLRVDAAAIPDELKVLRQWVGWRLEPRNGRNAKVPYQASRPDLLAKVDDPKTWAPFDVAMKAYSDGLFDGIGFVFSSEDPYCGIDLDNCVSPGTGEITNEASKIIEQLNGYTELSPSKTGVHIIVRASLADLKRRRIGGVEFYDSRRYFTMTGRRVGRVYLQNS